MSERPLISVAIPAYNYARYLPAAIRSVLAQAIAGLEIVVVDDCSTDGTGEAVAPFLADPRVRYLRNAANLGAVRNINKAIAEAQGRFILLLGADDFLLPGALGALHDALTRHPDAGFAYGNYVVADENDRIVETIRHPGHIPAPLPPWRDDFRDLLCFDDYINLGTTLFRREVIERCGFFDETLAIDGDSRRFFRATDWDLCLRLALAGVRSTFVHAPLSAFRVHSTQASVGGDFDREGIGLQEFAVLLERYVRPENAARLAGSEEAIRRLLHGKVNAFTQRADLAAIANPDALRQRIARAETVLGEIAANAFAEALPVPPPPAAIVVADDNPQDLLPTLDDLARQTLPPEVVVVNRGRMDLSPLVAGGRYLQITGAAVAEARDHGARLCDAAAFAFVDPGNRLGETHCQRMAQALAAPGALVVQAQPFASSPPASTGDDASWRGALAALLPAKHPWREGAPPLACFAMRRHVYFRADGFDRALPLLDDLDFLLRLADRFAIVPAAGDLRPVPMLATMLGRASGAPADAVARSLQAIATKRGGR